MLKKRWEAPSTTADWWSDGRQLRTFIASMWNSVHTVRGDEESQTSDPGLPKVLTVPESAASSTPGYNPEIDMSVINFLSDSSAQAHNSN